MTTARDLINAIKEDEVLREEAQRAILTQDLLNLPTEFRAFVQKQEQINGQMTDFINETREYHRNWERKYNRDVGYMKNFSSTETAKNELPLLAVNMGLQYQRSLSREEIVDMALSLAHGVPLSGDLHSFARADIIIEAERNGEPCYVPVEVSFTADERDTTRAVRNAGFLAQITGREALPSIASFNLDRRILDEIESGRVHHHQLEDQTETAE